jgi:hypothetical protein
MILLQRLCWNTNGWREPSGKVEGEGSNAGRWGFGHEEWNFNVAQPINGQVHGYLRYQPSPGARGWWEPHDIYFFTMEPATKRRLLVGAYYGARFLRPEELAAVLAEVKATGLLAQRVNEVLAVERIELPQQEVEKLLDDPTALRVAVPPGGVRVFDPRELTIDDTGGVDPRHLNRVSTPKILDEPPGARFVAPQPADLPGETGLLPTTAYVRYTPFQMRLVERRHNALSNRFRSWLNEAGAEGVVGEVSDVDVRCRIGQQRCLFELKIVFQQPSTRFALREALGQLLDYSYYPGREAVDAQVIVIDQPPTEGDRLWMRALNHAGMRIDLVWWNGVRFEASCWSASSPIAGLFGEGT